MIFVDASAIVAILNQEPEAAEFIHILESEDDKITSPIAVFEAAAAVTRERRISPTEAAAVVRMLLMEASVMVAPINEQIGAVAVEAFEQFGKGRHPARLNMGDCFAYAGAKAHGARLLFKGDDFGRTDAVAASAAG